MGIRVTMFRVGLFLTVVGGSIFLAVIGNRLNLDSNAGPFRLDTTVAYLIWFPVGVMLLIASVAKAVKKSRNAHKRPRP